jgi:sugar phosphate isomerase/epimerase
MTIALQLYSVREAMTTDYEGTIRRVAGFGYTAVETARQFIDGSAVKTAQLFESLGLRVVSAHSSLPLGEDRSKVLDDAAALGAKMLVLPWLEPHHFASLDGIKRVADMLNEGDEVSRANGLRLAYHNHHFELTRLPDGTIPLLALAELTAPTVVFEVDTYWVKTGGIDPVDLLSHLGERTPLWHMKDGSTIVGQPMTALGDGEMDLPTMLALPAPEAYIVELDACATDMLEAVRKSYDYLKGRVQ